MSASKEDDLYDGLSGSDGGDGMGMARGGLVMGPLRGPGTAMGGPAGRLMTGRVGTAAAGGAGADGGPRPMTSVKGAGFQSRAIGTAIGSKAVNPLDAVAARTGGPAPPLAEKADNSPEEAAKAMERAVHSLIEASAKAADSGDALMALERAKEAGRRERALVKFKDSNGLADSINLDLTFACAFNLAHAYHVNRMREEALNTYALIVKNKQYPQAGRLRVNMGNIHFESRQFGQAVKMYRMALDAIPPTARALRTRVQRNIGHALVRQGLFQDAIAAFEAVMEGAPEFPAGFNLLVCHYALGDAEAMKRSFLRLLSVPLPQPDDPDDDEAGKLDESGDDVDELAHAAKLELVRDPLTEELASRQRAALAFITTAAKLIAPVIGHSLPLAGTGGPLGGAGSALSAALSVGSGFGGTGGSRFGGSGPLGASDARGGAGGAGSGSGANWVAGYDWVIEQLRRDCPSVASELQICKALEYMSRRLFDRAIDELKAFEKKETRLKARAAVNLSFLYFLEGDAAQASKYASLAVKHDRYNAKALVNMGNVLLERGEPERAKELYLEAIGVEADCVEAIFNLGLVNKQLGSFGEALQAFEKLHTLAPAAPEVMFQIASLHEALGNHKAAAKYLSYLLAKVPSDPGVLNRLGALYAKDEDETQAFHYHAESYRYLPVNLEVISWLGVWFVKTELYERAIEFFERASEIQPSEVKWKLMVASCHRRMANYARALECYEVIHAQHPDDIECLRFLIALCKDSGKRHDHYEATLARLERLRAAQAATTAAMGRGAGGSGSGAGSDDAYAGYGGYGDDDGGDHHDDGGHHDDHDDGGIDYASYGGAGLSSGRGGGGYGSGASPSGGGGDGLGDSGNFDYYGAYGGSSALSGAGGGSGAGAGGAGGYGAYGSDVSPSGAGAGAGGAGASAASGRGKASAAAAGLDRGFGSAADRFAAPSSASGVTGGVPYGAERERGAPRDDDFGDADVGDLLKE